MRGCLIIMAALATLASTSAAAEGLKLSGSARVRYEAISGQVRVGAPASEGAVLFRTLVQAEYETGAIKLVAGLWDSRAYGGKPGGSITSSEVDALELVDLHADIALKGPLGPGSRGRLELGRFPMDVGSRRLIAAEDYRNTTSGYTGARLNLFTAAGGHADLFYVLPQTRLPEDQPSVLKNRVRLDRESTSLALWGGIAAYPVRGLGTVEAGMVALDERDAPGRPTRDRRLRSLDARLIRAPHPHGFDYEAEAIWQLGRASTGAQPGAPVQAVEAWFVHLDGGYQFAGRWKPHLSVEYDLTSGDRPGGRNGRFDTVYGMRRVDYAPSGLYRAIGRSNISAPGLRLEVTPSERLDAFVTAKTLWLASATDAFSTTGVRDPRGAAGRHAGEQLDGRVRYWLVPDTLRFEADAVWLHKARFLKAAPNAPRTHDTAFLSLNLTASF